MPITEDVIDTVAHLMCHYFEDFPEEADVDAEALADYARAHGICAGCVTQLVAMTGGGDLADAFERVWDSEPWQAMRARVREREDERG